MTLTLTRGIHAALTITSGSTTLVVDPGAFGFPASVASADAVLVTHDHFDHVDVPALAGALDDNPDLRVYTPTQLNLDTHADRQTLVSEGDEFMVGDISVRVIGREQATASVDDDVIVNVGYLVAGLVLHPGDARPEIKGLDTLIVALAAPWQNTPQLEEYLRAVTPARVIGLHDGTLNDLGRDFGQKTLARIARSYGGEAISLDPGESVTLPR
ncbi:MBL fold metallo-hydrolase [Trueperella abortisuis]|uniref:L-ascorbate metabolism protein UlaG (Beta-lactamase superfamily) n=1 Tax=Trueperella abortisuis TaxID=445930 RepID=A0ABT9PKY4_9ACTO|nr:MBL fold metallo-hydrolase [Trueperella abortisuis]MDP9833391.1 L-ascorbate metabolism protein UlaG (beta-lactamase superfamily) [Trueperella abortisuis]